MSLIPRTKCQVNPQVLSALLKAAEKIGASAAKAGLYKVKRDRKGRVVRGYSLTEDHQNVMTTIDAYSRCKLSDEAAMAVLHEYGVFKARTAK